MKKNQLKQLIEILDAPGPNSKLEGFLHGVPIYSNQYVEDGIVYCINKDNFKKKKSETKTPNILS